MDSNGLPVGNYSGSVQVADSATTAACGTSGSGTGLIGCAENAGAQPTDFSFTSPDSGTVTITNGTGTFAVGATTTAGLTSTLTATASGTNLTAGTATVSTVTATAQSVALSIESGQPTSLSANTQSETYVAVTFNDAAGNPITSVGQYVTLSLTGPGTFVQGSTAVTTITEFDAGTLNVPVWSMPGQPGTITVNASTSGGFKAQPLTISTYINTTPASLAVTSTTGTDASGNTYTEYTVTVDDTNGHPISNATGSITVTDNSAVGSGELSYGSLSPTNVFSGTPESSTSVNITNGVATFVVETHTVGTGTVTLSITGASGSALGLSTTAQYTYAVGAPTQVALTPSNTTILSTSTYNVAGGSTVTITAQAEDQNGNPVAKSGLDVTFEFVSTASGLTFPNGLAGTSTYTVTTNANGVATLSLTMPNPTPPATDETFQLEASLGTSISSTVAKTPTITIWPSTNTSNITTQLVPNTTSKTVTAGGTLSGLSVTAENAVGGGVGGDTLVVTSSNTAVVPNFSSNPVTSTTTGSVGVATLPPVTVGQAGTAVLTITDVSVPSQPKTQITVTVSPQTVASKVYVEYNGAQISSTNPVTVNANTPVQLSVVNVDGVGDPIPVTGSTPLYVNLSVASGITGGFLSAPGGAPITQVEIQPGQSSATVYFESATAETLNSNTDLTASAVATNVPYTATAVLDPATGGPGDGYHTTAGYWLNSELQNTTTTAHAVQVTLDDSYGNPVSGSQTLTAATGFEIASAQNGTFGTSATVTFTNGVGVVYVENASTGAPNDLAGSASSNGTVSGNTTIATTSNNVAITTATAVTTLFNVPATYGIVTGAATTVSANSQVTIPISIPANTGSSPVTYTWVLALAHPTGNSNTVTVSVAVAASTATSSGNLVITTSGSSGAGTVTYSGTNTGLTLTNTLTGSGTTYGFTFAKGNIISLSYGGTAEGYFRANS